MRPFARPTILRIARRRRHRQAISSHNPPTTNLPHHHAPPQTRRHSTAALTTLPKGSWDSHVHVVDEANYPFPKSAPYRPKPAPLSALLAHESTLGIAHVVLTSISVYGTDNRLLLDSLRQLNGRARGVVDIDPRTISAEDMSRMHALGVRGVRLNLRSHGRELSREEFARELELYAERLRGWRWALQIYVALHQMSLLADLVPRLGVPVVIDHLAHPASETTTPSRQRGHREFLRLLGDGVVYTKLSGLDRFPNVPGIDDYVKETLRIAPTQVIWASDWPHTGGKGASPGGDPRALQDYRQVDDAAFVRRCVQWCGEDEGLVKKIWRDNPRRLWDYDGVD